MASNNKKKAQGEDLFADNDEQPQKSIPKGVPKRQVQEEDESEEDDSDGKYKDNSKTKGAK